MYINAHTYYSLRYGTFSEKELLERSQALGWECVALTDINNTSACMNFVRLAPKHGIRPVVGIDFRQGARQLYVALAQNNEGYREINAYLSAHSHEDKAIPAEAPAFKNALVIYPSSNVPARPLRDKEYLGVQPGELERLHLCSFFKRPEKLVLLLSVSFRCKKDFNAHRLLRAMALNCLLSKLPTEEEGSPTEVFVSSEEVERLFIRHEHLRFLKIQTELLLASCEIHFDFRAGKPSENLKVYGSSEEEDAKLLQRLCYQNLPYRYGENPSSQVLDRMEKELVLIRQMRFVSFFLINWDIVSYAKNQGYYHVGRGSGANSIVAYLLGITDVDPIDLDLYFERFMNLYRATPPDFDIDFSWRDREDVTRYIFERFGEGNRAALLATYSTFQHSAAIRELGKVFGLPKHEIDKLSDGKYDYERLDDLSRLVVRYSRYIYGWPNLLSVHAAGILIADKDLHYFSATDLPPKGFPTVQFDMVIAEDVGLNKFDILGQRGLGKIKDALQLVRQNQPQAVLPDIHQVAPLLKDARINENIKQAKCMGCFYVESPAMRMLLKKLEVDNYLGLVAASSIIRPGVSQSGMMREYILRHKDPERRKEAHPVLADIMPDTYGIMVYQEDVIKVAHHFAGLDLGEADVLRRGMSGKYRSRAEFEKVKQKFISNCLAKGYSKETTMEVWSQTESFAGYAFAKGHSASYAVESYQSLYLKTYFPLEFMVAVLNNGGGFFRAETYIHETRLQGGIIHAPCINRSRWETTLEGKNIYLGFQHLNGLEVRLVAELVTERDRNGLFTDLDDFLDRVPQAGIEQLGILLRIGAFDFTGVNKRMLLWKAHYRLQKEPKPSAQKLLFRPERRQFSLPTLTHTHLEHVYDQIELLGFPLCDPFLLLKEAPENQLTAQDMRTHIQKEIVLYGYLVTVKPTKTGRGERMSFGTFLDREGQWIDTVQFPQVHAKNPFQGKGIYRIHGKVTEEFGFLTLETITLQRLAQLPDPRFEVQQPAPENSLEKEKP